MEQNDQIYFRCDGWWEQDYYGRQPMEGLRLSIDAAGISGSGTDIIGPFTLTGSIREGGAVAIIKTYVGRHRVKYVGMYDGEGTMAGQWLIGPLSGRWLIAIRRSKADAAEDIADFVPRD